MVKKEVEKLLKKVEITEKQRLDKEIDSLEANILEMQQALERVRID